MTESSDGKERPQASPLERAAVEHSVQTLIEAAEAGIQPLDSQKARLMELWGIEAVTFEETETEGPPQVAEEIQGKAAAAAEVAEESVDLVELKRQVDVAIQECLDREIKPGHREYHSIFEEMGVSSKGLEEGKIVAQSLEESLDRGDSFHVIAQKSNILHDFPEEIGGGGFTGGMRSIGKIREKLLKRMLEEVDSTPNVEKNPDFSYALWRVVGANPNDYYKYREDFKKLPAGNARTKALLELKLGEYSDED